MVKLKDGRVRENGTKTREAWAIIYDGSVTIRKYWRRLNSNVHLCAFVAPRIWGCSCARERTPFAIGVQFYYA